MSPVVTPQHEQAKREQILAAAEHCFIANGFAGARIADIAKQAGIGKGTVYEYWRSKEALLLDTCIWACGRSEARMAELLGGNNQPDGDPINLTAIAQQSGMHPVAAAHGVFLSVLRVLLTKTPEEQQLFSELSTVALKHPELIHEAKAEIQNKYSSWLGQAHGLYQAGLTAGYFREIPDSEDGARLIVAAVDGLVWQRLWFTDDDSEDLAQRMAATWMRLLLIEPHRLEEFLA